MKKTLPYVLLLAALMTAPAFSATNESVILTKGGGDAVLFWNAGNFIITLKQENKSSADALIDVQARAARILTEQAAKLPHARTLRLNVIYPHNPEFNPVYNDANDSRMEPLLTLTSARSAALRNQAPKRTITGKLPW